MSDHSRFVIVQRVRNRPLWLFAGLLLWLLSLLLIGWLAWQHAATAADPNRTKFQARIAELESQAEQKLLEIEELKQQATNLQVSEQITQTANQNLQATIVVKDEEIAGLRADVAFYERLVGSTGQRRGLSVHEVHFQPETPGAWRYTITLTQNLNRAAISKGQMHFSIEGVAGDKLRVLEWSDLLPGEQNPSQNYSFRYFEQLKGSIMLPKGFKPQRVHVKLSGQAGKVEQTLPWNEQASTNSTVE